ncbi:hypothetical protein EI427_07090 [Flammeovirga pectinis]|uniref:Uncharacterized protein n=1 Tax=Flammeovirga pectinis TaxID=2494373 RepID=A0A3S9P1E6_9BACT|nr:hypothetical protein [Flammeovirga pectinis]AZQ62011.1 hypothetical protein EI427_07090 [Flammeovirga pectinis]
MNIKHFITITNFRPQKTSNTILFAPTGNNNIATWIKYDENLEWLDKVIAANNDVCIYTDGLTPLEHVADLVLSDEIIMDKFIWKDTVAYSKDELVNLVNLNNSISWHDMAFADRLIFDDNYPSNYYFAKKVNPSALSYPKNINSILNKNTDDIYFEKVNEDINLFIIPFDSENLDNMLFYMNNFLINSQNDILKFEGKCLIDGYQISIKKIGNKLIHNRDLKINHSGSFIFGVTHLNKNEVENQLKLINQDLSDAQAHIEDIIAFL